MSTVRLRMWRTSTGYDARTWRVSLVRDELVGLAH